MSSTFCSRCGAELAPGSQGGRCPRCLLELGLAAGAGPHSHAAEDDPADAPFGRLSLEAGHRLGGYEVLGALGRGGMGEVYRARDVHLGREVALKILPRELDAAPEHLERFEREAKVLASLNHPNIATLYGYENDRGTDFLVMELVRGQTLAERLDRGPLELREALRIFLQIARGLEAAHEQGIMHRDLKPANVEITPDGTPKLLDFGLARGFTSPELSSAGTPITESPTLDNGLTRSGVILGTAAYMSPEQAKAKAVDKRADIWAFGCCLFEAMTGLRPFDGDSVSETLANVLKDEPDWSLLPPGTPSRLVRLLRRCLNKDPRRRLRDIGDAAYEIEEVLAGSEDVAPQPTNASPGRRRLVRWGWVALGVAVGIAATLVWHSRRPEPAPVERTVRRFVVRAPEALGGIHSLAVSRDGRLAALSSVDSDRPLVLRRFDLGTVEEIAGTERGEFPFFSPDGSVVAFFTRSENELRTVPVDGGPVTTLADGLVRNWGGSWGDDGNLVFHGQETGDGLSRVPATGGPIETLTTPDREAGEESHRWPEVLPGSRWVIFTVWKGSEDRAEIAALSLEDGARHDLGTGTYARYLASGHLLFFREGRPMVAPFDPEQARMIGPAILLSDAQTAGPWGHRPVAVSTDGLLVYGLAALNRPVWVDLAGRETSLDLDPGRYSAPNLSSHGDRLAVALAEAGRPSDIWVFDLDDGRRDRLTFTGVNDSPVWASDDQEIVFWSQRTGSRTLFSKPVDGSRAAEPLLDEAHGRPVTATGSWIATNHDGNIWLVAADGSEAHPLLETPSLVGNPSFSPDGRFYAYMSDEAGYFQGYIASVDGGAGRLLMTQGTVSDVLWSPRGDVVLYRSEGKIWRVGVQTEGRLRIGTPVALADDPYARTTGRDWSFSPDGERILLLEEAEPARLLVVESWLTDVARRAPRVP